MNEEVFRDTNLKRVNFKTDYSSLWIGENKSIPIHGILAHGLYDNTIF